MPPPISLNVEGPQNRFPIDTDPTTWSIWTPLIWPDVTLKPAMKRHGTRGQSSAKSRGHTTVGMPWLPTDLPPRKPTREESKVSPPREAHPFGPNRHDAHWKLRQRPSTRGITKDMGLDRASVPTVTPCGRKQTGVVFQTEFVKDIKRPLGAGGKGKGRCSEPTDP